ncbi:MAG: T9SS type A sorting domain-containing protein [Saprospiraceae bacterium]
MKKPYFFALALTLSAIKLNAQCTPETPLGSTVNTFDWRTPVFELYLKILTPPGYLLVNETSPFHVTNYSTQPNTFHLAVHPGEANDYEPTDGWELLFKNFGTQSNPVSNPSIGLYNRYDSKIRIFVWANDPTNSYQSAMIELLQPSTGFGKFSAVMEHSNSPMNAVEEFDKSQIKINTSNVYTTQNGTWLMFEYVAAYDPCTCYHSTGMRYSPKLFDVSNLDFKITGSSISEPIVTNGATNTASDLDFAAAFGSVQAAVKKGYKAYTSYNKLNNDFVNLVNGANPPAQGSPGFKLPKVLKLIPYGVLATNILEFLFSGEKTASAARPSAYHTKYEFAGQGTITTASMQGQITHYTPGSVPTGGGIGTPAPLVPTYNNILGVINLTEVPKISKHFSQETLGGGFSVWVKNTTVYKLAEPLKYAFNEASGLPLNPSGIRAAIFFKPNNGGVGNVGGPPPELIVNPDGTWRTPYLPLDALDDYAVTLKVWFGVGQSGFMSFQFNQVIDESNVTIEFVNTFLDGQANETFYGARYKAKVVSVPNPIPANPYINIPENLTLRDPVDGQVYLAWNSITIEDGNNLLPTENILFYSTQIIFLANTPAALLPYMNGNSLDFNLYPPGGVGINFNPKFFNIYNGVQPPIVPILPQSPIQIGTFCSTKYNPVVQLIINSEENELNPKNSNDGIRIIVAPSPFSDFLSISVNVKSDSQCSIELLGLAGERVQNVANIQLASGENNTSIGTSDLCSGVYFLVLNIDGQRVIKKVVKL